MTTTYVEKLRDPRWQKKRLQVLNRDNWTCQNCGNREETLNVHHFSYTYGKDPWDYLMENFLTLCESCHEAEGEERKHHVSMIIKTLEMHHYLTDDLLALFVTLNTGEVLHTEKWEKKQVNP